MLLHDVTSQKTEFMIVIMLLRCVENSVCGVKCHHKLFMNLKSWEHNMCYVGGHFLT